MENLIKEYEAGMAKLEASIEQAMLDKETTTNKFMEASHKLTLEAAESTIDDEPTDTIPEQDAGDTEPIVQPD